MGQGQGGREDQTVAEARGGRVDVEGQLNKGTTFRMLFASEQEQQMNPKLLIVDDDEEIRTQMKWALANDYDIVLAGDRPGAVEAFATGHPPGRPVGFGPAAQSRRPR